MLIQADARYLPLIDGCVQTVVTSPPYFALRDYGVSGQLGLEPTPDAYVTALVEVFRGIRRVLAESGTVWINLGDSYANDTKWGGQTSGKHVLSLHGKTPLIRAKRSLGLKSKDLIGIPWRVAFALQADGWYLRSDIIWSKPNPMPESVTDRPTKAHEYLFLLTKRENYYFDADAIRETASKTGTIGHLAGGNGARSGSREGLRGAQWIERKRVQSPAARPLTESEVLLDPLMSRNKRSVWTIPTMPYQGAHFATMPEALVEPCILAGSRLGDLILDPFVGSGTTLKVAAHLGRRGVGLDLNPQYLELARRRSAQIGLFVNQRDDASHIPPDAQADVLPDQAVPDSSDRRSTCHGLYGESADRGALVRE